jgi:hypothetical protein
VPLRWRPHQDSSSARRTAFAGTRCSGAGARRGFANPQPLETTKDRGRPLMPCRSRCSRQPGGCRPSSATRRHTTTASLQAGGARLCLRDDLRGLHLLRHHHRVSTDVASAAQAYRAQGTDRPGDALQERGRPTQSTGGVGQLSFLLTAAITCMMPGLVRLHHHAAARKRAIGAGVRPGGRLCRTHSGTYALKSPGKRDDLATLNFWDPPPSKQPRPAWKFSDQQLASKITRAVQPLMGYYSQRRPQEDARAD